MYNNTVNKNDPPKWPYLFKNDVHGQWSVWRTFCSIALDKDNTVLPHSNRIAEYFCLGCLRRCNRYSLTLLCAHIHTHTLLEDSSFPCGQRKGGKERNNKWHSKILKIIKKIDLNIILHGYSISKNSTEN